MDANGVSFEDDTQTSDWAKPSVHYMAKLEVIKEIDGAQFAPDNAATGQEATGYAAATRERAIVMTLRISKISDRYE